MFGLPKCLNALRCGFHFINVMVAWICLDTHNFHFQYHDYSIDISPLKILPISFFFFFLILILFCYMQRCLLDFPLLHFVFVSLVPAARYLWLPERIIVTRNISRSVAFAVGLLTLKQFGWSAPLLIYVSFIPSALVDSGVVQHNQLHTKEK